MFRLYLVTAWRNLKKNRVVSIINISGLTVGLTCSIFAIYYSVNELTYENCHTKADQISKVYSHGKFGSLEKLPSSFPAVGNELIDRYPEIEKICVSREIEGIVYSDLQPFNQDGINLTDHTFFDLFDFTFIKGTPPVAGKEIALSQKMANKFFGKEKYLGKSISLSVWGVKDDYSITGVFEDLPDNTHLNVSCIIPLDNGRNLGWTMEGYQDANFNVYAQTRNETDIRAFNAKLASSYEIPVDIESFKISLIPIKRIHLHETITENNLSNLLIILIGGIVSLILSCFSYINLTAILFTMRRQEVGIKKVNGGGRKDIIFQFLTDTGLTALISLLLAYVIIHYLFPGFNTLMDRDLNLKITGTVGLVLLGTFLFTTLFSGLIPAWALSRTKPVNLVRKEQSGSKSNALKNTLLTVQFVVAIILLQFFIISNRQFKYMFRDNIRGFNSENVLLVDGWQWGNLNDVRDELLKNSSIEKVTWCNTLPGASFNMTTNWKEQGNKDVAQMVSCTEDYLDAFKIKMVEGRFFSETYKGDQKSVVINSLTANSLGYNHPIGKTMFFNGSQYQIIGLVDNYMSVPVVFDEMPLIFTRSESQNNMLVIRSRDTQLWDARDHAEQVLRKANPDYPLELKTYDELVAEYGKSYMATGVLTNLFTLIIIVNAMIGLFGLSFFVAQHKNKEVGIRKVCGASIKSVIWRLSKGFALKLMLALSIATPMTFFAGGEFVKSFTRHISMTPDLFILGGLLALVMVVFAAGWKIAVAAVRNPVESLRYE